MEENKYRTTSEFSESKDIETSQCWGGRRSFLTGFGATAFASALPFSFPSSAYAAGVPSLVNRWTDEHCLTRRSINMWWAKQCEFLPCFKGVAFPGYAEYILFGKIDGEDTIIHLWKGYCNKFEDTAPVLATVGGCLVGGCGAGAFAGSAIREELKGKTPGGCGGEVGIYRKRDRDWIKNHQSKINKPDSAWQPLGGWVSLTLARDVIWADHFGSIWFPAPELKQKMWFKLYYEKDGVRHVLIDTRHQLEKLSLPDAERPENYYWCTEFVEDESYNRWEKKVTNGGSIHPVELTMEWHVGEKSGVWAYSSPLEHQCQADIGCVIPLPGMF